MRSRGSGAGPGASMPERGRRMEAQRRHHLSDTCLIILLIHPTLSGYAFNFFNCRFVEELGARTLTRSREATSTFWQTIDSSATTIATME